MPTKKKNTPLKLSAFKIPERKPLMQCRRDVITDRKLTNEAKLLFVFLSDLSCDPIADWDGSVTLGNDTYADNLGLSSKQVLEGFEQLAKARYIAITQTKDGYAPTYLVIR